MMVALARKRLIVVWRYATTEMLPHGAIMTGTASASVLDSLRLATVRNAGGCVTDLSLGCKTPISEKGPVPSKRLTRSKRRQMAF